MEEIIRQLKTFAIGMWKYRWPAVLVAWVVAAIGVLVVFKIPDQYEASARIYVDTQSILKPLMAGLTVQPNVQQQIGMLSRTLISRPNLEKLIRMADADLRASTKVDQEALIEKLTRDIQIRNTGRDNLYSLVYRDSDQDKAKRIIQSLVSIFVESSLGASRKDSDQAKTFLNEQIKQYEAKLEEAEARRKAFRIRNIEMASPDGKDAAGKLADAYAQLEATKLQLREAENARDAVKQQLAAESGSGAPAPMPGAASEPPPPAPVSTPEIDARIETIKRSIDGLLQRYTEAHPDILQARRLLKELEAQKQKEVIELRKAAELAPKVTVTSGAGASMVQQELGRMLAASEVQVASLRTRLAEFTQRMAAAREGMKTAPALEAEVAQLNRDYGIIKGNYDSLVSRRQQAIMSGELEVASGVADFRLIDPPRVTPKPVAPNRLLLLPLPLLAGLAAGLALAFVASQLRPVFMNGTDLRAKTGLPVLGVISLAMTEVERRRERLSLYRFAGASGGLVGLFIFGLVGMALFARSG